MRDHPEGLRGVVLDSPFPPNVDPAAEEGPNIMEALNKLFNGCANNPACDDAYPDLREVLLETVALLNETPEP